MFCMKCGKKLPDNAVFCSYCGTRTPIIETQTNDTVVTEEPIENNEIPVILQKEEPTTAPNINLDLSSTNFKAINIEQDNQKSEVPIVPTNNSEEVLPPEENTQEVEIVYNIPVQKEDEEWIAKNNINVQPQDNEEQYQKPNQVSSNEQYEKADCSLGAGKLAINFILGFLIFLFIAHVGVVYTFRYLFTQSSVEEGYSDIDYSETVIESSTGETCSFEENIMNKMSSVVDKYNITEEEMSSFLRTSAVTKSIADIHYLYMEQFIDGKNAETLSAEDYVNVFKDNPEEVSEELNATFTEDDYAIMKEGFVNGFYNNMTTQHIKNSYPISLINMLLSKTMLWFSIVMVILLSLIFLLVNNLKMFKMFKLLLIGILVDSFVIGIVLVILVETQSSVFTSGLTIPFLPILIIASGIIAYLRIRAMRTKHKES